MTVMPTRTDDWPPLPYEPWRKTLDTLHMYLQIVGKVRLALEPMEPQWAQVPLYVTARGLNTSPIPHPAGPFDIDVDFLDHVVTVRTTRGRQEAVELRARSVADFYVELMGALAAAGVPTKISERPSEVPSPIPFPSDTQHQTYEPEPVTRFWRALTSIDIVLKAHRARFRGKVSPVQFFWGSFDLAYTRYSGRLLDPPRDADVIMRYSHDAEQTCVGFWPGDTATPEPAFYAYTYPSPSGIENASVRPASAGWSTALGEFLLPYEAVRTADDPRAMLLDFLETAYRAGAELARWDPALALRIATLT
jgi:hypothetical protein